MAAVLFCGCDKEEGGDNLPCPVTEVSVPASSEENPVSPGSSVTIQGQGFTANSEIWLRAITRAADVQAEVTDVTATTVTFTAPDVSGEHNILLKQDGGEWILGVLHFPEVPNTPGGDEEEPAILPTRISHVRVTWEEDMTFVLRYTYDAEGRIVTITETDQQYNFEGAPDESFEDEVTTIEYAPDRIVVTEPEGAQSIYALADGRTTAITSIPGGGVYLSDYTFSYDENGYIAESTWVENPGGEYSAESVYTVIDGSLVRVQEKESSQEWYGGNAIYENDPVQLNNLNIDLFGMSDFIDETDLDRIYLFGAGGNRFKTLPVKIDYGEDGVTTYRYEMDGEYISRIDKFQENESSQEWYGGNAIYENDPVQLNNLNIDLFGMSDFIDETDLDRIYLFGAGGNRFKTLPVKIDYGEDGVTTYRYEMDGEYISRIDKFQENELTSILEIFYEE